MFTVSHTEPDFTRDIGKEIVANDNLRSAMAQAALFDPIEDAASFGRWWFDSATSQMVLSTVAAGFLDMNVGLQHSHELCFAKTLPEDRQPLMSSLERCGTLDEAIDSEFRIINEFVGMRWLRIVSLPRTTHDNGILSGLLIDISASRQAAIRERLSLESARLLVGNHTIEQAVTKVIQLVCEILGWEWGAYWALEPDPAKEQLLACKYYWHGPAYSRASFTHESAKLRIAPGDGLVGKVWQTGLASWAENLTNDPTCLRRKSIMESSLRSGYAFPVAYQMADGQRRSPGVLEFFSSVARQREAQLPNISPAIGALVAKTIQRLEQMEIINRLAQLDELTGLSNRRHFHQQLNQACTRAASSNTSFGLLFIDIDRFKPINDVFGHEAGNSVLREFARRLTRLTQNGCQIGRLGGDEFAVFSYPNATVPQLISMAERILAVAHRPFHFAGNELMISASIGISIYPDNGAAAPELLHCSDAAMYQSKHNGRNGYSFFSSSLSVSQSAQPCSLTMEEALHHALRDNQFFLEYQPIFDSFGENVIAMEALIRWRTPNGDIVRPDIFIPTAEKSFLIAQIDRWVIRQACSDLALLHRSGFPELQVNVNMSASEFLSTSLPDELLNIVHASGLTTHHICLELTENMVMQHADKVIPIMESLRKRGFHIGLDDFGTGHSSLSRLKQLPISSLKIDRSFVKGLPSDEGDCAIVRTIFDLGHHMGLQIIAEGVETDAQLNFLRQFGYPWMQGFLLGRPMGVNDLIARYTQCRIPANHSSTNLLLSA